VEELLDIYTWLRRWGLSGGRARMAAGARGRVLELGIGGGANLPYYRGRLQLVGLDPRSEALTRAAASAAEVGRPAALVRARAEALPFQNSSFDTVAGSLVLCSVGELEPALAELRRVLAPGGQLRLVEHVRPVHQPLRLLIGFLAPLWFRWSHECHIDRDTPAALAAAGWRLRERREHLGGLLVEIVAEPQAKD